jgi:hypothetical protein
MTEDDYKQIAALNEAAALIAGVAHMNDLKIEDVMPMLTAMAAKKLLSLQLQQTCREKDFDLNAHKFDSLF